jgi:hypothetical protein
MIADMPFSLNPMPSRSASPAGEGSFRMGNTIGMTTTHTAVRGT